MTIPTTTDLPAELAAIIAGHRAEFAGFRMALDDSSDDGDEDETPDTGENVGDEDETPAKTTNFVDADGKEWGFPVNTPQSQMNDPQRVEYLKHKSRKHENRAKQLADENRRLTTELEQARAAAQPGGDGEKKQQTPEDIRRAEEQRAEDRAWERYGKSAVKSEFRAAFGSGVSKESIDTILQPLDLRQFLDESGDVDSDKVIQYVDALRPGQRRGANGGIIGPDMGQGRRGDQTKSKSASGLAEAQRRFGKKQKS